VELHSGRLFVRRPLTELIQQKAKTKDKSNSEHVDYQVEVVARDSALNASLIKSARKMIDIRVVGSNMHAPEFEKVGVTL
jgi:alkyl hydroperoxide reductase subunit AhpF